MEDSYVILECLNNHLTSFSILQYNLKDQVKLFGYMTVLSSISPVGLSFFLYIFKYTVTYKINYKYFFLLL